MQYLYIVSTWFLLESNSGIVRFYLHLTFLLNSKIYNIPRVVNQTNIIVNSVVNDLKFSKIDLRIFSQSHGIRSIECFGVKQ